MDYLIPNALRRQLFGLAIGSVAISLIASGCATSPPPNRTYNENMSAIMLSADKKKIVFFGKEHHYVFDMPVRLIEILDSQLRPKLEATFYWFRVLPDRTVTGEIMLSVSTPDGAFNESNREVLRVLAPHTRHTINQAAIVVRSEGISIRGHRYANQSGIEPAESQKLNRTYQVTLTEWPTTQELAEYNSSPVKKMSDGVMSVLYIPLTPIVFFAILAR
ncbi:MAG: hypothetical protein Q7J42_17600 [Sulfuritalea sp.]|nr:hypothetical protein [Sulfuritalea sp.]